MKKILSFVFIIFVMTVFAQVASADLLPWTGPTPTPTPAPTPAPLPVNNVDREILNVTKTLRPGMRNSNDVKILQNYLNTTLSLNLVADGNFGNKTKLAVITFQKINNIGYDGVVGSNTFKKIKELLK